MGADSPGGNMDEFESAQGMFGGAGGMEPGTADRYNSTYDPDNDDFSDKLMAWTPPPPPPQGKKKDDSSPTIQRREEKNALERAIDNIFNQPGAVGLFGQKTKSFSGPERFMAGLFNTLNPVGASGRLGIDPSTGNRVMNISGSPGGVVGGLASTAFGAPFGGVLGNAISDVAGAPQSQWGSINLDAESPDMNANYDDGRELPGNQPVRTQFIQQAQTVQNPIEQQQPIAPQEPAPPPWAMQRGYWDGNRFVIPGLLRVQ